jgi:hypothetical protein
MSSFTINKNIENNNLNSNTILKQYTRQKACAVHFTE